jgi:hypothetical protein
MKNDTCRVPTSVPMYAAPVLFLGALLACGCSGTQLVPSLPSWFDQAERTSYHTPATRIDAMKELAAQAATASAQEQLEIASNLANQVREETDPVIREQIVRTLSVYTAPVAHNVLEAALLDDDSNVRVAACEALARRLDPKALESLADRLVSDADVDVRLAAARALGEFRDPQSIKALGDALDDSDPALQRRAVLSLERITGRDLGPDVNAWRNFVQNGEAVPADGPSFAEQLRKFSPL